MVPIPDMHPMTQLKNKLKEILAVIPPKSKIYYLDYPVYNNGGDILIMKGTETFFQDFDIQVVARYSALDFPEQMSIPEDCIIVMHGGGNFGDLYEAHQRLREHVVAAYTKHRVVILPQTIHYKSEERYEQTAKLFNSHPDLHIFIRDTITFEKAKRMFHANQVYLMPDMAHQLWPIVKKNKPRRETLYFYRTDIESKPQEPCLTELISKDWDTLYNPVEKRVIYGFQRTYKASLLPRKSNQFLWYRFTDYLMNRVVQEFANYQAIETSRLHGHILSCLMDKPNVLIDNSYGKNYNYYKTWTYAIPSTEMKI